jgi:type I restriction enzyme S subunit
MSKAIPKLRFKEFSDKWKLTKIGQVLSIGSGRDYKHLNEGDIPVYGTGGIMTMVNDSLYDGDTVCIGRKGTIDKPMFHQGKIWTVDTLFYTHSFINTKPRFVYNLFERINWKLYNEASGVPSLSKATIEKIHIAIPTLPEQQKIASFLSAVDEKIHQLTRKKELLEQYKKGVMQQLFSSSELGFARLEDDRIDADDKNNPTILKSKKSKFRQLRFKDENGKAYPKWEEKRLGDIGDIVSGLTYSPMDVNADGVLVLRSSNVQNRRLTFEDNVYVKVSAGEFNPVKENDILICVRNGSKNLIGKNALIDRENAGVAFGAFMTVYRSYFNSFLFHYFDTDSYKDEVHKNLGATINSINGSDLKKFKIPFPCKEEQQKIASFLSAIDTKIESVAIQIEKTQTFKKGLLQQMFV